MRQIVGIFFRIFFYFKPLPNSIVVHQLTELYKNLGFSSLFVKIRIWDAPFEEINKVVPKSGNIVELGCGEGLCSNYLALSSPKRKVFGIEIDSARIKEATRGLKNTKFIKGDITKINIPAADSLLLIHVLHHLHSPEDQIELLKKCKTKIKKGALFLIVEIEPKFSWKYFTTWFTDHFLVPWLFEHRFYSPIYFCKSSEWKQILTDLGFSVTIKSVDQGKPFSHVMIQAIKK